MAEPQVTEENKIPVEEVIGDGSWGDTANDVRDMQRLGKKQEFKVRRRNLAVLVTADWTAEKFWFSCHARIRLDLHGYMGVCAGVRNQQSTPLDSNNNKGIPARSLLVSSTVASLDFSGPSLVRLLATRPSWPPSPKWKAWRLPAEVR